jgi:hypothetical protein
MAELFIYYRLHAAHAARAQAVVAAYQHKLQQLYPGLVARLLCKAEDSVQQHPTWMETYRFTGQHPIPHDLQALQAQLTLEASRLTPYLQGERHTEVFKERS